MMNTVRVSLLVSTLALSACSDAERLNTRTALLHSGGPQFSQGEVAGYLDAVKAMRGLYGEIGIVRSGAGTVSHIELDDQGRPIGVTPDDLAAIRDGLFAYVDSRCDAYVDAIFWANRTRGGFASGNNAIAGATGAIVGATGGSATALAVLAAAFGLSGSLFDAYYDSVLYGLEPSGIQRLVNLARSAYRGQAELRKPILSEGQLLEQVQSYIRVCTPANIEYLVNEAIKTASVEVVEAEPAPDADAAAPGGVPTPVVTSAPPPPAPGPPAERIVVQPGRSIGSGGFVGIKR